MLVAALATSIVGAIPCACALDWDVRPDPGTSPDVLSPESSSEAASDAPTTDGGTDGTVADAPDCEGLLAAVTSAKAAARACVLGQTSPVQCATGIKDECDCDLPVRYPTDPKNDAWANAIAAYRASCTPTCSTCPQVAPASWSCLQNTTTFAIECFP